MPYQVTTLEHVGVAAQQVVVSCRHGEMVRVFPPTRRGTVVREIDLVRATAHEHAEMFGCQCAERMIPQERRSKRGAH